jgi:hypothetical protein
VSLGPCGSALVRRPSSRWMFRRPRAYIAGESRSDPRSRVSSPRLRAAELCSVRVIVFKPSRPSSRVRGTNRARTPAQSVRLRRVHRAGGVTPLGVQRRPRSQKPVAHASRLVAQVAPSVAFGLGVRILAAGPARVRLYSDFRRYVQRSSNLRELIGGSRHWLIRRAADAPPYPIYTYNPGRLVGRFSVRAPCNPRTSDPGDGGC